MKLGVIKPIQRHYTSKRNLTNYWVFPNSACHHGGKQEERGRVLVFSPILFRYYSMDFKKYLENRLMMKELQLMRAEDNRSPEEIISALFYVVKELRFIYKQLFWEGK